MPKTITQSQVLALLRAGGASSVTDLIQKALDSDDKWVQATVLKSKGVSAHAEFPNGWVLSVQGGDGLYSQPRAKAEAYEELECAVLGQTGENSCKFFFALQERGFMSCDSVAAYMAVERLPELIEFVAGLPTEVVALKEKMFCDGMRWDCDTDELVPDFPDLPEEE